MRAFLHKLVAVLATYGPFGVCLLAAIDSVGIPLPAALDVIMIGIGAANARDPHRAYLAALLAVAGSTGGNIGLFVAARGGRHLLGVSQPSPDRRGRFHDWFHRYGLATVFIPAVVPFLPLPLKFFVISAGAMHVPLGKFIAVILIARVIRYFGEAWLGIKLGHDAQGFLIRHGWSLAGAALALAAAFYLLIRWTERRTSRR